VKEETRYRVTGSLFLLALAVIFLPMLFDGAGLPTVELPAVETVPVPEVEQVAEPEPPPADLVARVEALRDQIDDDGFDKDTGTQMGEPVLSEVGPETRAWAVQVASFADVENAKLLRAQLQEDGYEAFLSTIRTGDAVLTRVAVGPLQSRAEAATLQAQLSTRYEVNARLMAFST
jgi:DedD protein